MTTLPPNFQAPPWRIQRTPLPLPDEARAALERGGALPRGPAYRTFDPSASAPTSWYPVVERPPPDRARALLWPALRTGVPAGISLGMLGGLIALAGSIETLGLVGMALGSAIGALVARTQYRLERGQHALGALWLASDFSRVLVARFDSLQARLSGRPRWYVLPIEALAPPGAEDLMRGRSALDVSAGAPALRRWAARVRRTTRALAAMGIDGATIDPLSAARVHTLARLARLRRLARGRP